MSSLDPSRIVILLDTLHPPVWTAAARREMRRTVQAAFRENLAIDGEQAFAFVTRLSSSQYESKRDVKARPGRGISISLFAM